MEFSEPNGICLQIADRIRERILPGEWKTGERIPSIRELAIELGVNPNTVTKSYQKLLDRELISNQRGRGYFVSENAAERALQEMRIDSHRRDRGGRPILPPHWSLGDALDVFDVGIPSPMDASQALHEFLKRVHDVAGHLFVPLLALHVAGAVKHAIFDRCGVAMRMVRPAPGGR